MLTDYPRWRAFLEKAGGHLDTSRDDDDPLKRLAGALAFVRQGVTSKESERASPQRHLDTDLELREVGGEQTIYQPVAGIDTFRVQ